MHGFDFIVTRTMFYHVTSESPRGGSRAAATFKMERFVIIVNGWKPLTIITKRSILDVAAALDPPRVKTDIVNMFRTSYFLFKFIWKEFKTL